MCKSRERVNAGIARAKARGVDRVEIVCPDGYGVYDMAGNIWQWCLDWSRPD